MKKSTRYGVILTNMGGYTPYGVYTNVSGQAKGTVQLNNESK